MIRRAALADAVRLAALARTTYADAFGFSFTEADLRAHLDEHLSIGAVEAMIAADSVLVAERNGEMLGFIQYGPSRDTRVGEGEQEVRRLYVLGAHQGKGIGSALMRAALADPVMQAAPSVTLDVWERNPGAQRLYRRFGFEVVGRRKFDVASGADTSDELIMRRSSLTALRPPEPSTG